MALSDITRKLARSDLRARLAKVTTEELNDSELNQWLNMGQFDTSTRLSAISDHWYGSSVTGTDVSAHSAGAVTALTLPAGALATNVAKFKSVVGGGASASFNGKLIPWCRFEELHGKLDSSLYDNEWAVSWFGEKLYFFWGTSVTMTSGTVDIYFVRKADEMTADSGAGGVVDVPTEYVDLVILYAQSRALNKLNMLGEKNEVDQDIAQRLADIRSQYANEAAIFNAEKQPGVQTPRKN
jgi:hypothetical protein